MMGKIGVYEIDFDTLTFIDVNDVICQGLGYTRDELIGQPVSKILTEDGISRFMARLNQIEMNMLIDSKTSFIAVAKNGQHIPVNVDIWFNVNSGRIISALVAAEEKT